MVTANLRNNLTERARDLLDHAREEAVLLNHSYIGTEHLLLALAREGEGVAATVLTNIGVDLHTLRNGVNMVVEPGEGVPSGDMRLNNRAKRTIELAIEEARGLGHPYTSTGHLLLGVMREGEGAAAGVLEAMGVTLERARKETVNVLQQRGIPPMPRSR